MHCPRLARATAIACATGALAAVLASTVAAAPTPAPAISVKPDASCATPASCTDYDISIANAGSVTIDGVTIQLIPAAPITGFKLFGQPAGKPTGVQKAWEIGGATIGGHGSATGTFHVAKPLAANTTMKVFTTTDGFLSTTAQDVSFPSETALGRAIANEQGALAEIAKGNWTDAAVDLSPLDLKAVPSEVLLAQATGKIDAAAEQSILGHVRQAMALDSKAQRAVHNHDANSAAHWVKEALAQKEAAQRLLAGG